MLVRQTPRFATLSLLGMCRILLLPLLLLFAQQGALMHELSHYTAYDAQTQHQSDKQGSHGKSCELCLAFAQVGTAAAPDAAAPGLLADLSFNLPLPAPAHGGTTEPTAARSRGPPITL